MDPAAIRRKLQIILGWMLNGVGGFTWKQLYELLTFPTWDFPRNDPRDNPLNPELDARRVSLNCGNRNLCAVAACIRAVNLFLNFRNPLPPYFLFGPNSNTGASLLLNRCGCSAQPGLLKAPGFNFDLFRPT
jgi:hypothetical protein